RELRHELLVRFFVRPSNGLAPSERTRKRAVLWQGNFNSWSQLSRAYHLSNRRTNRRNACCPIRRGRCLSAFVAFRARLSLPQSGGRRVKGSPDDDRKPRRLHLPAREL